MRDYSNIHLKYPGIPAYMWDGVDRYVNHGILSGGFLTALFENDLMSAFARADLQNQAAMAEWAKFIYNDAPSSCWGSREVVDRYSEEQRDRITQLRRETEQPTADAAP